MDPHIKNPNAAGLDHIIRVNLLGRRYLLCLPLNLLFCDLSYYGL